MHCKIELEIRPYTNHYEDSTHRRRTHSRPRGMLYDYDSSPPEISKHKAANEKNESSTEPQSGDLIYK